MTPMAHTCHWPGCDVKVPPKLFACRPHWFALPSHIRAKIWTAYVPGQEISKDPSPAYIDAALTARQWILAQKKP
jgi:hypothetical protein